ncbi:MAG TPA: class I SAM-dependent methyltransferase [Solirubrobacterales bacterium]|nr:class I SAM-dependent methyltransferase [Solirubrobacterales bacterium]
MTAPESARDAYDRYAAVYDECNAQNDYEMWLGEVLLPVLEEHGLQKGWALDVGCGTGRAFDPLLARGWEVVGCDVSSGMLAEAARKFGSRIRLLHVDARSLPPISPAAGVPDTEAFHLILLLNDVVNYVLEDGDLEKVFAGVRSNLSRDGGLVAFDANTLGLFRDHFALDDEEGMGDRGWDWQGLSAPGTPGSVFEARLSGRGVETHIHRQRHWTSEQVTEALAACGLERLALLGQREEGGRVLLSESLDEERDEKAIYVAAHAGHSG